MVFSQHFLNQSLMTELSPVISRFCGPPRSPDLTPIVLWLRVYVKFQACQFHPQIISDLKDVIRTAIQEIPIA